MLVRDGEVTIQCHLSPDVIMESPEWVRMGVEQYFNHSEIVSFIKSIQTFYEDELDHSKKQARKTLNESLPRLLRSMRMPTPEEYARAMGFSNFAAMRKAIENPSYKEASRHYLLVGCSIISDMLTRAGLSDRLNSKFVQFVMSAYLGVNEKREMISQSDNKITIEWGSTPMMRSIQNAIPLPSPEQLALLPVQPDTLDMELDRLERALPNTMQLPVYKALNPETPEGENE